MRVRVLKDFSTVNRAYHAGEIVDISPRKAEGLMKIGLVMQDKSLDGARETKAGPSSLRYKSRGK